MGIKKVIAETSILKKGKENDKLNEEKQSFYCESEFIKSLLSQIHDLKVNDKLTRKDIKSLQNIIVWLQAVIAILIAIIGIVIPIIFNEHSRAIDKSVESYFKESTSKYELINQQLGAMKELNSMQIQRDVAKEIRNKK